MITAEIFSLAAEMEDRRGDHESAAKGKLIKNTLTKQQDQAAQRSIILRRLEQWLSTFAVCFFVLGYLPVVVYIVALCHFE